MEQQINNKKNNLKNLLSIVVLVLVSALVIFLFVKDDWDGLVNALTNTKWIFILYALGLMLCIYLIDATSLMVFTRQYKKDYSFKEAMQNAMIGSFFSSITPSATGGQIAQVYAFSKTGVSVEKSTSVLVLSFIMFQSSIVFCSILAMIFYYNDAVKLIQSVELFGINVSFVILIIMGFALSFLAIAVPVWLSYSKIANKIVRGLVKFLAKIKIIKKPEETLAKVEEKVEGYRTNLAACKENWKNVLVCFALSVVRFIIYYSIPYFIGLGLGVDFNNLSLPLMCAFGCFIYLLSMFIVIPGASGGAEAFFVLLFGNLFISTSGASLVAPGMLLWRFVTFYIPLVICAVTTIVFNRRKDMNMLKEVPNEFTWIFNKRVSK